MSSTEKSTFAKVILDRTYAHFLEDENRLETWNEIAHRVTKHVMKAVGVNMRQKLAQDIYKYISEKKMVPGGRYLYAAGKPYHQVNNCALLKVHDSREGWAELLGKASMALMSGAGVGVDYSDVRCEGAPIRKTGGVATGPLSLMQILNECGRGIMQGGNRRCLVGNTRVTMSDGTKKNISEIRSGDYVYTRFGSKQVTAILYQEDQELFKITVESGRSVVCSANHRWLAVDNGNSTVRWSETSQLRPGIDELQRRVLCRIVDDPIISIERVKSEPTYDIQVADVEEFIANDLVSHNSAIWAGLRWNHPDICRYIRIKNWPEEIHKLKAKDYSFPAILDCTNISVQLDDEFFKAYKDDEHPQHALAHNVYWSVIEQMLKTGEPGFTVDIGENAGETLRNACGEVASRDSDDICNLGSINLARVESIEELKHIVDCATAFLLAGSVYSDVPYSDIDKVRSKNRRLGLGLMGVHEWLLKRGKKYAPDDELGQWLSVYSESGKFANKWADEFGLSHPEKTRAIAPNGTTGIVAETTGGIETIFCVAYKRSYLKGDQKYYQYVIDPCAKKLIESGIDPEKIEDAYVLAQDVERRVEFQAWIQGYVDHCISSTINMPAYGSQYNNADTVRPFGDMLLRYLPQLRGITCYPDGSRSGQPLTPVPYSEAVQKEGVELVEESMNVCSLRGGSCGD